MGKGGITYKDGCRHLVGARTFRQLAECCWRMTPVSRRSRGLAMA